MGRGSTASIQEAHIGIDRLDEDVAWLTSGRACAILAVGGVNLAMLDDDAREARLAAFAGLLNALTYPIQILLRITPLNLLPYLDAVRERARREPSPVLAALGHDHAADLRRLASDRLLLEKHFYVVVTDEDTAAGWGRGRDGRGAAGAEPTRRRLAFRCEELARLLRRCDLPARRLDGTAMAHLYRDWWGADGAAERDPADLADCDRPAVRAARRIVPAAPDPAAGETAPAVDDPPRSPRLGLLDRLRGRGAPPTDDARDPDLRHFAAGLRTVADFIAPAAIEVDRDWIRLDSTYATALAITGYPAAVAPGWLRRLTGFDEPLDIALHIRPLDTGRMVRALNRKLVQLQSSALADERAGRLGDKAREIAVEQIDDLQDALQRGEERLFSVAFYIILRAATPDALAAKAARVHHAIAGMLAQERPARFEMDVALRAGAPMGEDRLRRVRNLETSSVATTFPFDSGQISMDRGVLYGLTPHEHSLLILDPFDETRLANGNTLVCATSGAGKSFFVKVLAGRNLLAGVDFIVVDPEDEYRRLCAQVGGQYVRLALGAGHCINPFDLPPTGEREAGYTDPVAEQTIAVEGLLQMLLADGDEGGRLTPQERPVLLRALRETYARAGITGVDRESWGRPAPVLDDLRRLLLEVPRDSPAGPLAADLAARLEPYVVGGALDGFLNRPTNVDLGRRFVVFNIQALDGALHPLAIHIIAGFVWRQLRWRKARRRTRETMLVVDEAWSLFKHERGGRFLEEMARRARKYGLALVTITQRPGDFLGSAPGQAVLANATIKFLLRQDASQIGVVGEAFGLTEQERHALVAADPGTGLLFALEQRTYLEVVASPAERAVATTAPRDIAALEGLAPDDETGAQP